MNILHKLKHDFLIIGFAGPLRSGCTTSAKFFVADLAKAIQKQIRNYEDVQNEVEVLYKKLYKLKESIRIKHSEKTERRLSKVKRDLRDLLKSRETLKVLSDQKDNNFLYVSMTDLLVKSAIENADKTITFPQKDKKSKALENLLHKIIPCYPDIQEMKRLGDLIRKRDFHAFGNEDFKVFEKYLGRIRTTRNSVSKWLCNDNDLIGELLQDLGDNLRRCGNPWCYETHYTSVKPEAVFSLAEAANDIIKFYRSRERENATGEPRIKQFVIEAFRNPYEVEFFRNRYYEFYLISLFADYEKRRGREKFSEKRDKRDRGEDLGSQDFFKQNVSECVRLSDIAINNDNSISELRKKLVTYFALVKQPGCFAPEWKETAMHMAYSMSVRSTCVCRQVGAVIEGANGYIIGAGWNDVGAGQVGCGYRHYKDFKRMESEILISNPPGDEGFRRWLIAYGDDEKDSFCYKDKYSEYTIRKKLKKIEKHRPHDFSRLTLKEKRYLTESLQSEFKMMQYCRALHAEENAILQTAVIGGMGVREGTVYTTTFPCELCAKKIYQAGIKRVVYTEPYPRSISKDVFFRDGTRQIECEQFEGVKSQSYFRLYKATIDKKEFQRLQSLVGETKQPGLQQDH